MKIVDNENGSAASANDLNVETFDLQAVNGKRLSNDSPDFHGSNVESHDLPERVVCTNETEQVVRDICVDDKATSDHMYTIDDTLDHRTFSLDRLPGQELSTPRCAEADDNELPVPIAVKTMIENLDSDNDSSNFPQKFSDKKDPCRNDEVNEHSAMELHDLITVEHALPQPSIQRIEDETLTSQVELIQDSAVDDSRIVKEDCILETGNSHSSLGETSCAEVHQNNLEQDHASEEGEGIDEEKCKDLTELIECEQDTENSDSSHAVASYSKDAMSSILPDVEDSSEKASSQQINAPESCESSHEDAGFSASTSLPGLITYSGPIAHAGSCSIRSDSSTTSARSFAFPILQSEWNSSPVRMAKAERMRHRMLRRWRHTLLCCKF